MIGPVFLALLMFQQAARPNFPSPPPMPPADDNIACIGPFIIMFDPNDIILSKATTDQMNIFISCQNFYRNNRYHLKAQSNGSDNKIIRDNQSSRALEVVDTYLRKHGIRPDAVPVTTYDPAEKWDDGSTWVQIVPSTN